MHPAESTALRQLAQDRIGRANLPYADLQALRAGRFEEVAEHLERRARILVRIGIVELLLFLGVAVLALEPWLDGGPSAGAFAGWIRGGSWIFFVLAALIQVAILVQNDTALRAHAGLLRSLAALKR